MANMQLTRIIGANYNTSLNATEIWNYVIDRKPRSILMESFCTPESDIQTGGIIDYEEEYGRDIMKQLLDLGAESHRKWSGELAAVVAGVGVGAEIRFCDRMHSISFNRFINKYDKAEVVLQLLNTLDSLQDADDNAQQLSKSIPELWTERHEIMSHVVLTQKQRFPDEEILAIIGSAHTEEVQSLLTSNKTTSLDDLLTDYPATYENDDLDKRLAVAALLSTTMAFHPNTVVSPEDIPESLKSQADKVYNNYRSIFRRRLEDNIPGSQSRDIAPSQEELMKRMTARFGARSVGLLQLPRLSSELKMVSNASYYYQPETENMAAQRSEQNWREQLGWSSDPASLVQYETSQLINTLLGNKPLDTATVHHVQLVGGLLDIVLLERDGFHDAATIQAAVKTFGFFMKFLVRCHNSRQTHLLNEVERAVVTMMYNISSNIQGQGSATHEQIAPYAPFLLHAAFVQLKAQKHPNSTKVFSAPPKRLGNGCSLAIEDQYIWLCSAMLPLVAPEYFAQLLRFKEQDADTRLQTAYAYELLEYSLFYLIRSFEKLYAAPLNLKSPAKQGCAEPKVSPKKVLSFLSIMEQDPPPSPSDFAGNDHCGVWKFEAATAEMHAKKMLHSLQILNRTFPRVLDSSPGRSMVALTKVMTIRVKYICGVLHWILTTLVSCIHTLSPFDEDSLVVLVWRNTVECLTSCIIDYAKVWKNFSANSNIDFMLQLLKGCLTAIAVEEAFTSYHPQGSLRVNPLPNYLSHVSIRDSGFHFDETTQRELAPSAFPMLMLFTLAHNETLYKAFAGLGDEPMTSVAVRPPLELCLANFLHGLFMTHTDVAHHLGREQDLKTATVVPIQNIFRGIHTVLQQISTTTQWSEVFCSGFGCDGNTLAPNWKKASDIAKGFAALPFSRKVDASQVEMVSQNAWSLVRYYFQLSIPCAPTAPPSQISYLKPKSGWDDYDEYFRELERSSEHLQGRSRGRSGDDGLDGIPLLPTDFGLNDGPGDRGYRLHQLLSSHLRGILTVIPYFRLLFVILKRECLLKQCAHYCSSLADLILVSSHSHGVAIPFLRTSLACYEHTESYDLALATVDRIGKIFLSLMDLPSAAFVQAHGKKLAMSGS